MFKINSQYANNLTIVEKAKIITPLVPIENLLKVYKDIQNIRIEYPNTEISKLESLCNIHKINILEYNTLYNCHTLGYNRQRLITALNKSIREGNHFQYRRFNQYQGYYLFRNFDSYCYIGFNYREFERIFWELVLYDEIQDYTGFCLVVNKANTNFKIPTIYKDLAIKHDLPVKAPVIKNRFMYKEYLENPLQYRELFNIEIKNKLNGIYKR